MRYIYYILGLFAVITLAIGGIVYNNQRKNRTNPDEIALQVNGRDFTKDEFRVLMKLKPHDLSPEQYAKTIIDKEILIQEAMNQKIHEEPAFKATIKNFYEQSLISTLMTRKSDSINPDASEKEISGLVKKMNTRVSIITNTYSDLKTAKSGKGFISEKKSEIDFADLSDNLKFHLSIIEPGEKTAPLPDDAGGYRVITLEGMKSLHSQQKNESGDEAAMRMIAEKIIVSGKKKYLMESWQQELKNRAEVHIGNMKDID